MTYEQMLAELLSYPSYQKGWDSYKAEPPYRSSLTVTRALLEAARRGGFLPWRVAPTVMGGCGLAWYSDGGDERAYIEIYNHRNPHLLLADDSSGDMQTFEVPPRLFPTLILPKIRDYVQ